MAEPLTSPARCLTRWLPAAVLALVLALVIVMPANAQPAGTQPPGTQPPGTQPPGTQPAGAQPAEPKPAAAPPELGKLLPPVSPACISSPFGPRVLAGLPKAGTFHPGIDMPAPAGGAVRAVADGQVIAVRRRGAGGLYVMVRHAGFDALYAHLGSLTPAFAEGKRAVAAGEKLGVVGRTGVSYGAHLYFQMEIKGERVDPAPYLGLQRCG